MNYYHDLVTEKSWQALKNLRNELQFILIGGWAVFLLTRALKSKDIDLIADFRSLQKFKEKYEVVKNDRLKKYEARAQEVEIDIYIPFYSNPGIPAEEIRQYAVNLEGFLIPAKEVLTLLKIYAFNQRAASVKGRKDLLDLIALFQLPDFGWKLFYDLSSLYQLREKTENAITAIKSMVEIEELSLNRHQMAKFKKKVFENLDNTL